MKKRIIVFLILFTCVFIPKILALSCEEGMYKVTYNANGGTISLDPTCVSETLSNIKPTRRGYKFLGWSLSKTATTAQYKAGGYIELTSDTTLYAVWSKGIKLTYNANGGKVSSTSKTIYPGTTYGTLLTPTRKGYKFLGWYTAASGGSLIQSTNTVNNKKAHTLYAHWQKIKYTITYELNSGTNNSKNKNSYYITTGTFKLETPTRKGCRFLGWYKESNFKTKVTYIYKGSTGNRKLYARWTPIKYNISFYGNGATSGSTKAQKNLKYGKSYVLNSNGFKKTDYVFVSWNTKSDGTGKSYDNNATIKSLAASEGKTVKLYVIWKRREYKITYVLNGGVNPSNQYNYYSKVSAITLKEPTRSGYKFLGWYTESDFQHRVTKIEKGTTGNKTFYAKWKLDAFLITYVLGGGTNPTNAPTTYVLNDNKELPTPTRNGYDFKGWYLENTFETQVERVDSSFSGNITIYAKWEKATYSISYVLNDGTLPDNVPTSYTVTDEVVLPIPEKEDLGFGGWYTNYSLSGEAVSTIPVGSFGNKVFYAKWTRPTYSIIYNLNGGTIQSNAPTSYISGDSVTLPTNVVKNGYAFAGWYDNGAFIGDAITKITSSYSGNIAFYAKWELIEYDIDYNLVGGTLADSITSYTIESNFVLPTPTKTGYTFKGWYDNSSYSGSAITQIEPGNTGDLTLYAKWSSISYYIRYMTNGGYLPGSAPTGRTIEQSVTLPTPTKTGFGFEGWYKDSDLTDGPITVIPAGYAADLILYAKWGTPTTYSINWVLNGGTMPSGYPTSYTDYDSFQLPIPTKDGLGFDGWYDNSSFNGNPIEEITVGTTGDKTFYAKWGTPTIYSINWVLNGGTLPNGTSNSYTNYDTIVLPTPTKDGNTFEGWYTESNFINRVTTIEEGSTGNKTFYAKWNENTLERIYNYVFYNNDFDNLMTSVEDAKNSLYNIMNKGLETYSLYCSGYSNIQNCFDDFSSVSNDQDMMKAISDYVNPFNSFDHLTVYRETDGRTYGLIRVNITYNYTSDEREAIDNVIDTFITDNNIGTMTDYNKILEFHDYLVNNIVYDVPASQDPNNSIYAESFSAYGALLNGKAVCQGYTDAMALFLDRYRIPNLKVSSDTHTWNLIYINNEWKHLDATWDDPVSSTGQNYLFHNYFLITTDELHDLDTNAHIFNTSYYLEAN